MVFAISWIEYQKPKPIDWTPSFSLSDKIPFGTFILFERIQDLFPEDEIVVAKQPIYNQLVDFEEDEKYSYIFVNEEFQISELDARYLFQFVEAGNDVLISASRFDFSNTWDTLKLETESEYFFTSFNNQDEKEDSKGNNFTNPELETENGYLPKKSYQISAFSSFDTLNTEIYGVNPFDKFNFIKMKYGEGNFYLNTTPYVFTNYNMLDTDNSEYVSKVLSHIEPSSVILDDYYKQGRKTTDSQLRYFLNNIALKWLIYLAAFGSLVFIIFEGKRKQRIIPILEKNENSSIEFVETISDLYLSKGNHRDLADKKIAYFYDYLRNKLRFRDIKHSSEFYKQLSNKTGIEEEKIDKLFLLIRNINQKPMIYDSELVVLNRRIDEFYEMLETIPK